MKTTKLLTWMLACLMAATMTSCLGSDDDDNAKHTLSKSEIHQCYLQMAGDHSGKMYFTKSTLEYNKLDSVDVTWTVKSEEQLSEAKKHFDAYIFDSFVPAEFAADAGVQEDIKS